MIGSRPDVDPEDRADLYLWTDAGPVLVECGPELDLVEDGARWAEAKIGLPQIAPCAGYGFHAWPTIHAQRVLLRALDVAEGRRGSTVEPDAPEHGSGERRRDRIPDL